MRKLLLLASVLTVGCATNPRVEDLSSEQRAKAAALPVLSEPPIQSYEVLGTVTGLSCNRNKYQAPNISDEEALQGLKINAVILGADAVINSLCQTNSDTDWRNNCWASVKCVGDAIKLKATR
jgi:hypothetical protein